MVMSQRYHRGFTAAEKTELWDRWQRGESLKAIGRAFGKAQSTEAALLSALAAADNQSNHNTIEQRDRELAARPSGDGDMVL